MTLTEYLYKVE